MKMMSGKKNNGIHVIQMEKGFPHSALLSSPTFDWYLMFSIFDQKSSLNVHGRKEGGQSDLSVLSSQIISVQASPFITIHIGVLLMLVCICFEKYQKVMDFWPRIKDYKSVFGRWLRWILSIGNGKEVFFRHCHLYWSDLYCCWWWKMNALPKLWNV